ncbi:non-ribosomal peptide synthetase [Diplogelasinospora grovesii]|uniref:Non-ribosomal peptide synthetase n=1 Tax=Diplogelasinospora grovesii TaxID=303347 RepID=A0AAN6N2F8_9PEZI|nr:non-ribosomal peptide synthetase [Diplogelasinospora grovesii]
MASPDSRLEETLSIINHPAIRLPGPELLHELVQHSSDDGVPAIDFLSPDGTRVSLSYEQLHKTSHSLARRICASSRGPKVSDPLIIPVLVPQRPELYVALLGILKAGGAFCPLNLDVPPERAKFILKDVSARMVITTSELAARIPTDDHECAVLLIDDSDALQEFGLSASPDWRQPNPADLAYVVYTSGSTGTPKGVGVSHGAATQSLLAHDRHIPPFSRFLQFAAPTFDVSVFEIFFPLLRGKTLVSCSRSALLDDLPLVIRKMGVDACELTPTVAGSLLRKRENAPNLRLLLTIGEMLTMPVVQEFGGSADQPSLLWGMYGPTEAAIHCTLQSAFACGSPIGSIGVPLDSVSAFVLQIPGDNSTATSSSVVLPRGEIGELAVGGYQLADGYMNRPEQTAAAFVDSPYGRLYRTGDKARIRPDGTLECLGRISDGQIKLRGQRVELGEVEQAALRTQGCHSAAAAVVSGTLVLFCAVDTPDAMTECIQASCKAWLPGFMLPGDVVVLESFPRLASGKVDRKRLIADYSESRGGEQPREPQFRDELEKELCTLAHGVLAVGVHPYDNLSRAGMDSIVAVKFASALRVAGFQVSAVDILGCKTISALHARIRGKIGAAVPASPLNITHADEFSLLEVVAGHTTLERRAGDIDSILRCTPLQASMLAETTSNARAYCNWIELSVPAVHSDISIRSWFCQLAQMNESLRTGFVYHEGQFLQVIFKELSDAQIRLTDSIVNEFEIQGDKDLLQPFRIQVLQSSKGADTTVVLQAHHAIYDGWSMDMMVSDLESFARGERPTDRPQYRRVSAYCQSQLFSNDCDAARGFWAEQLAGFQPAPLPILKPEQSTTTAVCCIPMRLNLRLGDVRRSLQEIGCGPQVLFQACLTWLWSSVLGSEDVVIGSVASGRTLPIPQIEDIAGPCISALPIRTDLSQVRTIKDVLSTIHAVNRAVLPHSMLPLPEIKRAANIRPGQPLFDVLFVYQESLHSRERSCNEIREVNHQDYLETKLLVEIEPKRREFVCRLTYHSDAFLETHVDIMAQQIQALASHMLGNLDSGLFSIQHAFPRNLLSVYNPNPISFSGTPDLARAVERVAVEFPDKNALCFAHQVSEEIIDAKVLSFRELNDMANKIAWHLRDCEVRERGVVAIVMEKSVLLYAGILAILKAGCAYLPVLPSTPTARIEAIFQTAEVEFCLVDTATRTKLRHLSCNFVDLESLDLRSRPISNLNVPTDPSRLSYVIYTSGSTGVPKGVCMTQLNIMSNIDVLSRIYPVKEDSRLLQSCSQAFDVSVFEIFFAWTQGMCLCSAVNDVLFEDLERSIRRLDITHLSMTPTVASLVDPTKTPLVEFLVTAGEAMTEVVARKWAKQLHQGYGPSETTNICSVKKMGPNQVMQHLGWSFENTSTVVLFRNSTEVVPLGGLGELCFGGDQVARGYLKMLQLTSSKFINHPIYGRLYRSGDLGRMLPDGSMIIAGRMDDQIKLRGLRIEVNEITSIVRQSPEVVDCATLFVKQGATDTGRLVTFIVPEPKERPTTFQILDIDDKLGLKIQALYQLISSRVPVYMIPSYMIPISVLPVTASGKLDRGLLNNAARDLGQMYLERASHSVHSSDGQEDDTPWSDVERKIAQTVSSTFGVPLSTVQRWTPLSTLGLDSISAIEVSKQLQRVLGKRLPISAILQHASVARLAQVSSETETARTPERSMLELFPSNVADAVTAKISNHERIEKIIPCTPLQEAMLAASAGRQSYLNRMLFRIFVDPAAMKNSWDSMVERHGILRTCFVPTDDTQRPIVQVVLKHGSWQPEWRELDASKTCLDDCISKQVETVPNSLESMEPPLSFALIAIGENKYLSFICHHALYDGVAIEKLLFEVEQLIGGTSLSAPPPYESFLTQSLLLPESTDGFWRDHLDGFVPQLISQTKDGNHPESHSTILTRPAEIPLSQVNEKLKQYGISLLSLSQSAWSIVLGCLFQTDDICFGNVINGRSLPIERIDELVAPCFNTIPVRMQLSEKRRNLDLMKAFQSLGVELLPYHFTPLRHVQSLLSGDTRHLFDTLLLLQQPPRPLDQSVWTLERDAGEMDVPLVCELIPDPQPDTLVVKLHPNPTLLSPDALELIFDLFSFALRLCLRFPASQVSSAELLPEDLKVRLSRLSLATAEGDKPSTPQLSGTSEKWSATESCIRAVLSTLSTVDAERIYRRMTIYQLGLDSISAVQIASMLRKQGIEVSASDVIGNPTCETLARYLDTRTTLPSQAAPGHDFAGFQSDVQAQIAGYGITYSPTESLLPCTPLQAGMMAQFIESGGRDYFNFIDFRMDQDISTAVLAEAWLTLYHAHPILRTRVVSIDHPDSSFAMIQHHADTYPLPLTVIPREHAKEFSLDKWRLDASYRAIRSPHRLLWAASLVETEEGVMMHVAIHHVLYDAHSLQLLLGDLAKVLARHRVLPAPRTEVAILDILSQVSASAAGSGEFWKKQADKVVINRFPTMTPLRESSRGILVDSAISCLPVTTLEQAVAKSGYTMQVVLQAAWARILSSYLGEGSAVFGVVLAGRNTEATRDAVFPCITTLPVVATNVSSNRDLLEQMLAYNTELFKQQHTPLTRIQQLLGCPDTRLFDTLLVYQKLDVDGSDPRPWRIVSDQATVDYPVSLEVERQTGNALRYQLTFFSDVLPKEQARLLLRQFDATVRHLVLEPAGEEASLANSAAELLSVLPPEQPEIPSEVKFLHQFVESQALKTPTKTALRFVYTFKGETPMDQQWTYSELNLNANRVAQLLLPHVQAGDIVAIHFDKCPEAYFSILGILKAGCAFVALDPGAPPSRKEFIVKDSGATVLLASEEDQVLRDTTVSVPVIAIDCESLAELPCSTPVTSRRLEPSDVCYCLYTSGTTGTPKGCEITHENAVQAMLAFQKIFEGRWNEDSNWLQFASLHFDVSVLEQYWSWSVGIALVAAPRDLILEDLAGTISRLNITHIDLTPSLARLLHPDDVPSLCRGVFITGGESLKQEILDAWGSKGVIYNFYGPTEATIGVTVYPRVPRNGRSSNIGRQFINVGSYVLKPGTEEPVLRGAVGELCVTGKLVGKGYLRRDDLTAERFPTLQNFGGRVYRTGDLVRVLHDGCFDFLGRSDDQVKLRGQRLEIGEINHAIKAGVREVADVATLVVRNEKQQKDFLVSFIVDDQPDCSAKLPEIVHDRQASERCRDARRACHAKLPGYMVPTYVFQLSCMPLSRNNKVEMKELKRLFSGLSHDQLLSMAPRANGANAKLSETGQKIAMVLARMHTVEPATLDSSSSIFELGVDSVSVFRFSRALKKEGLLQANPAAVLRHPTLGELADALDSEMAAAISSSVSAAQQLVQACGHRHVSHVCKALGISPRQIQYIAPCSPLQEGMLSRATTNGTYFNAFRFQLAPDVSTPRLMQAWKRTVDACAILRTRFVYTVDGPVQAALKSESANLPWMEEAVASDAAVEDLLRSKQNAWIHRNKDSLTQPWEILIVQDTQNANSERLLVLHMFHGLYDAHSFKLMLDKVASQYVTAHETPDERAARLGNEPTFLEALCHGPLQSFDECRTFWIEHLKDAQLVRAAKTSREESTEISYSTREMIFQGLETLRSILGVSHQAVVQAAWAFVLAKQLGANPTMGMITSGRAIDLEGAEFVVGPMFNTLPFHVPVVSGDGEPGLTWSALARKCHSFNVAVLPFQHVPLRNIQKWCAGGKPLFDNLFSFQREDMTSIKDRGLWKDVDSGMDADYPLALEVTLTSDHRLQLLLVSRGGVASSDILSSMLHGLETALTGMSQDPGDAVWPQQVNFGHIGRPEDAIVNGHIANGVDMDDSIRSDFVWTKEASLVRKEMASLADVPGETVTETTSVFGLGLDSIDLVKLSARMKKHGIAIKPSQLMKAQTISSMSRLLKPRLHGHSMPHETLKTTGISVKLREFLADSGYELGDIESVCPATPLQDSMMAEMMQSDFQLYFNHDISELSPGVDKHRLIDAWTTVVANSPILRTSFWPIDSPSFDFAYCQVVSTGHPPSIAQVDLESGEGLSDVVESARQRARQGGGRSDLLQLVFANIPGRKYLVLSIAHALYDGWSLSLLHHDVQAAYHGCYRPRPSYEPYLHGMAISSSNQDCSDFWAGFLDGATPTLLPGKETSPSYGETVYRAHAASCLSASSIRSFCKQHAVTLQTLGQACWAALLATKTRSLDVTFGAVLSGRDSEIAEALMFPTMNTVAVRSVLHGTVSSWLQYMQESMANISQFQHYPLRKAQSLARRGGGLLFNTLFIQQHAPSPLENQQQKPLVKSVDGLSAVEYPVCMEMETTKSKLMWRIACDGRYVSRDETHLLLHQLDVVLGYLLDSPRAEVLSFSGQQTSICGLPSFTPKSADHRLSVTGTPSPRAVTSWSPMEERIRDVLAEISGVPANTILQHHSIYHLGLDSISAIKASSLLRKKGVTMGVRDMLKAKSIAEMAELHTEGLPSSQTSTDTTSLEGVFPDHLEKAMERINAAAAIEEAGLDASMVEEILPATSMQAHMLSVWQNTDGQVFYPEFVYTLDVPVDAVVVASAWMKLAADTPLLRTTFVATQSREIPILQVALKPQESTHLPALADANTWTSSTGTPIRVYAALTASRTEQGNWTLRLKIHHALYDAISLPVIMKRFASLCTDDTPVRGNNDTAALVWKQSISRQLSDSSRAARKQFWTSYLADVEPCSVPSRGQQSGSGTRVSLVRESVIADISHVKSLCVAKGVSIQALFFAVYASLLASMKEPRPRDVAFGIYLANRADDSTGEGSPYPTLCLVPLRVTVGDGPNAVQMAARIQADIQAISSSENVNVGLWEIQDWTGVVVDSFVNFISLPASQDGRGQAKPREVRPDNQETAPIVEHVPPPSELANNTIRDAYPDPVDIEVALHDQAMTIGVFGPSHKLGEDGASHIISSLVEMLGGLRSVT